LRKSAPAAHDGRRRDLLCVFRGQAVVNKISWQKAGRVTEPGRYMFTFGFLTVTESDLAVWKQFPNAMFTLVELPVDPASESPSSEFHLGAFELPTGPSEI
jgi:hypothetical protein